MFESLIDQNKWLSRNGLISGQVVKSNEVRALLSDPRLLGRKYCVGLAAPWTLGYPVLCSWLSSDPFRACHPSEMIIPFHFTASLDHKLIANIPVFLEYVVNWFLDFVQLCVFKNKSTESWSWQGLADAICVQSEQSWVTH